jgi:hypothetical protein
VAQASELFQRMIDGVADSGASGFDLAATNFADDSGSGSQFDPSDLCARFSGFDKLASECTGCQTFPGTDNQL